MKTIKFFALLAAVLTLAACNKDKEDGFHERDIMYIVEGQTTTVHLATEAEWDALLDRFCDYAEGGSSVTFRNAKSSPKGHVTKEAVTYSTTDREEMKRWMAQMEDEGKTVTVSYDPVTGTWNGTAYATAPQPQGDYWVDLGLPSGLLWAKCNLGANTPEEYGNYYAWGETTTKDVYNWSTYRYCTADSVGTLQTLTKYNTSSTYGTVDTLTTLQAMDDAATAALGSGARTPTIAEWVELYINTTVEWTTMNGVNGRKFTSTANGNTLFLPAAGVRYGSEPSSAGSYGYYWSSSLNTDYPYGAWYFFFTSDGQGMSSYSRYFGHSVRAVRSAL
jgi:hypothetical protein